jgi:hypothetical protein
MFNIIFFFQILSEYVKVMGPVATCLDRLQAEYTADMGILLPNVHIMKTLLERLRDGNSLEYAQPLVEALLTQPSATKGFAARFGRLYEDQNILMATALHPHNTLVMLRKVVPDKVQEVKERIVRELEEMITSGREEEEGGVSLEVVMQEEKDYFDLLLDNTPVARKQEDLNGELIKTLDGWQRAHSETPIKKDLFPSYHREAWVELFIKYNTPLPSSAAVERMFSCAGDILRAKRSSLTASNFEELVFMRGNSELLGFKDEDEEDQEIK